MKIILSTLVALLSLQAMAQEEAVPAFSTNAAVATYLSRSDGAGFQFSPTVEIAVTALGFGGMDLGNYPYQVNLYQTLPHENALIATVEITTNSTFYNETYYQSISPVALSPKSTYYLEAGAVDTSIWTGMVIIPGQEDGSFSANPDINYVAADSDYVNGVPQVTYGRFFFADENFQFTVVPEPSVLGLSAAGLLGMIWHRRRC